MHGDEMDGDYDNDEDGDDDEMTTDLQDEETAFEPFEPDDFQTPGEGFEVQSCPGTLASRS